jgi:hypothetical protein
MRTGSLVTVLAAAGVLAVGPNAVAQEQATSGTYRGVLPVVKADVSPPLRSIPPAPITRAGRLMVDPEGSPVGPPGPQDIDPIVQDQVATEAIPPPSNSFDGPGNIALVSPPDPVGDVGPNHYVAMSNLYFAVYDKSGTLLYGPAANNTLWAGFGGDCQSDNDGDPVVLYDQLADRWILTQFTASGPTYYNCMAISTGPDPTGSYYRYAVSSGSNFPDYPKYGVWTDAYYISTREFNGGFVGVGAYAINRTQMIAGDPSPQVVAFFVPPGGTPYNVGDGLLPSDLDGTLPPPSGSPNYFVGAMDDGGQYGAPQDALTLWKFNVDFSTPSNSTFTLTDTIPIAPYDTQFSPCSGRSCIPQPGTANRVDILSYRQRPIHRLAYRNFDTHESLVTNQSVEAPGGIAGIRWWEIRDPNGVPTIHQEGTFAPGVTDGVHRWMGSIAMDESGNMALGYSASNGTDTYPSVWYTGRLANDPAGTMSQGEGSIIDGTGSQTGSSRWGDYTSMNIDPVDDCTFWYVNQYVPTSSSSGWRLRIGSFKFSECGTPDFFLGGSPDTQAICTGDEAVYDLTVGSVSSFSNPVTLSTEGHPVGTNPTFDPNPVVPPGSAQLTIGNTGSAAPGSYAVTVSGVATDSPGHQVELGLDVYDVVPGSATLTAPTDGASGQPLRPTFEWTPAAQATSYTLEVDDDPDFSSPAVVESGITDTTFTPASDLMSNTQYSWRVTAENVCGAGAASPVYSFTTMALPGDCVLGTVPVIHFAEDFEAGAPGWTHSGAGDTWTLSGTRVHGGSFAYHATDVPTPSDQRLVSPEVVLPDESPLTLQFWNWQEMEDKSGGCWDGGILEVSTDGGSSWTYLPTTLMQTDPYDGPVTGLGGLSGWCGDRQDWLRSVVDLDGYAGETVRFRFRIGTDTLVGREGWYLDDVFLQTCEASDPDFSLTASPSVQTACAGDDVDFTITVGSAGGFSNDVALGAAGNPAGSTTAFSTNPVSPPGASTLTIGNTAGSSAGSYLINVSGTAAGSSGHDVNMTLDLLVAPGVPALTAPPDGATEQPLRPVFEWNPVGGADGYTLEVDDDPAFGSPEITATKVTATSYTPTVDLAEGTQYWWRVTADNLCGLGSPSDPYTFTTETLMPFSDGFETGDTSRWTLTVP